VYRQKHHAQRAKDKKQGASSLPFSLFIISGWNSLHEPGTPAGQYRVYSSVLQGMCDFTAGDCGHFCALPGFSDPILFCAGPAIF